MALSDKAIRDYAARLLLSRMRILNNHSFYGLLLMHLKFAVDENTATAYTDGERIVFGTEFLDLISDSELDFVMMHEIMHVVLRHTERTGMRDNEIFNIACDIVVNSNILLENSMDVSSVTLHEFGESIHRTPSGTEGHLYSAEQVYEMLIKKASDYIKEYSADGNTQTQSEGDSDGRSDNSGKRPDCKSGAVWDDHSNWGKMSEEKKGVNSDLWSKRIFDACEAIRIRDPENKRGLLPGFAKRIVDELRKPQTNWRVMLNDFVQEEITDYTFSPPDKRFSDGPFFLPDFNDAEYIISNILFMIDTSGSMSDKNIADAYAEIKGAIDQFGGKLQGWLGFFDARVIEPKPFDDVASLKIIRPEGGGGTNFDCIFEYVFNKMNNDLPVSIIILTDGCAPYPKESIAKGIPVMWIINNKYVTPPWGKIARIDGEW